jgi:hypothetical protein
MPKDDKNFTKGLIAKKPHDNAPDFVKATLSIKVDEFIEWLGENSNKGWVNIDVKESRGGKWYAELNDWKPKKDTPKEENPVQGGGEFIDSDIPFMKIQNTHVI